MKFYSVNEIAQIAQGQVVNSTALGEKLSGIKVSQPSMIGNSQPDQVWFFFSKEYQNELVTAKAGILITGELFVKPLEMSGLPVWKNTAIISCKDPYLAMALVMKPFAESLSTVSHIHSATRTEVHPTAIVHSTAKIGEGVQVGAGVVIEAGAEIGDGCVFYPGCYVGPKVKIGKQSVFFPNVILYEMTVIGDRARIHASTVLGADGFGYAPVKINGKVVSHQKIYHLGRVIVGDDVEIGAQSSIDRGTIGDTKIGTCVKIDNNVHLGHNVEVGDGSIICGNVGMAGSSSVGKFVYVGGMSGFDNKVHVGDRATIAGMTGVTKDVPDGSIYVGSPAREYSRHFQTQALLNRMVDDWLKKKEERRNSNTKNQDGEKK